MRKDVEGLHDFFPAADEQSSVLETLKWPPKPADMASRFSTLLSAIDFNAYSRDKPLKLLDLGCGLGLLLDYLAENRVLDRVDYVGVDLLDSMLDRARQRWPGYRFLRRDVRDEPFAEGEFDYCIACGIFTVNHGNTYEETLFLAHETLKVLWPSVRTGLSFNSMSKHVDWEREDLFHWPLDDIMSFCKRELSRHVSFRLDYGLWECSTLVRRDPVQLAAGVPASWTP